MACWRNGRCDGKTQHRNGAGRRARQAHAADHRHDAEAAGQDRRQDAARLGPGQPGRAPASARPSSTSIIFPNRSSPMSPHAARRKSSFPTRATRCSNSAGGIVKALPELGEEPFYIINADTFWIDSGLPNLDRLALAWDAAKMDILLMLADLHSGDRTLAAARISWWRRMAACGAQRATRRA